VDKKNTSGSCHLLGCSLVSYVTTKIAMGRQTKKETGFKRDLELPP